MRRLILLALLALSGPASAAFAPDVVNTTDSNTTLRNIPSTATRLVARLGFATPGDSPPVMFRSSNAPCSLGAGNGDGGSQVKSFDGKCWLASSVEADIRQWGALNDGVTPAQVGAQAAITWMCANKATLNVPAGKYLFNAAITAPSCDKFALRGAGSATTTFYWPSGAGLSFGSAATRPAFEISGLTLMTGAANAGTALAMTNTVFAQSPPPSVIRDVVTMADDAPGTHYWTDGIVLKALSFVNVDSYSNIGSSGNLGNGLTYQGNGTVYGVVLNLTNSNFLSGANGFIYGSYAQGATVTNCNFTNGAVGILVPAGAANVYQLAVNASQFNTTGNQVHIKSSMSDFGLFNSFLLVPVGATGVYFEDFGIAAQIIGNNFRAASGFVTTTGNAINVAKNTTSPANSAVIESNTFQFLTYGANLSALTSGWRIVNNAMNDVTSPVLNASEFNTIISGKYPLATSVTGAANNGSGLVRLAVASTSGFSSGQVVSAAGVGGIPTIVGVQPIKIIDATHMDLLASVWSGAWTSGGVVSALP